MKVEVYSKEHEREQSSGVDIFPEWPAATALAALKPHTISKLKLYKGKIIDSGWWSCFCFVLFFFAKVDLNLQYML